MDIPWVEKYRPKTLDEIVGHEEIIKRLKAYAEKKSIPNMIFAGPAGTGKTTAAICLAREIFGEHFQDNFLELNASDERGINVIREKIKEFARTAPIGGAKFKIIFLDEASEMTPDAQQALRRIMEKYANVTRFILSCNYLSKIIDPIQSRCVIFKFNRLRDEDIAKRLQYIAQQEGLTITDDGMKAILYVAEGDMRRAINTLQAAAAIDKVITAENVYRVVAVARPEDVRAILEQAMRGNFLEARGRLHYILSEFGVSAEDVLRQMYREILNMPVDERLKMEIIDKLGEFDYRIITGAHPVIQLEAFLAWLCARCRQGA
ncbi:MAG: replication factor C small subunit [bacterium]|nr:replication factor C small subunit [bacterium]